MIRLGWLAAILILAPVTVSGTGEELPSTTTTGTGTGTTTTGTATQTTVIEAKVFRVRTSSDCYGQEVLQEACPDLPSCNDCTPVDCKFGDWKEWQDHGDCSGLKLRKRTIDEYENECGEPCNGTMTETARTELQEACTEVEKSCTVDEWGDWSICTAPTQQKFRFRKMHFTLDPTDANLLTTCDADTKETLPCEEPTDATDCKFGPWTSWTSCSESCDAGYQSRTRVIAQEAADGGIPCNGTLREAQMCNEGACPPQDCKYSQWSAWSGCNASNPLNRIRVRTILVAGNDAGKPCNGAVRESANCGYMKPSDCIFSDWCDWSHCTPEGGCGKTGQSYRVRRVLSEPFNGGTCKEHDLQETQPCSLPDCEKNDEDCVLGDWKEWGTCSTTCGTGDKSRTRSVVKEATGDGIGCTGSLTEISSCNNTVECGKVDCEWNPWSDWSDCTTTCGNGTKIHTRNIKTSPRNGGLPCTALVKREAALCNLGECKENCVDAEWGDWSAWTPCTASCGAGFQSRHRKVAVEANECGADVTGNSTETARCGEGSVTAACNIASDCKVQDWEEWSDCSATCFGHRYRHREVEAYARFGGKICNDSLREVESCAPEPGAESAPEGCVPEPKPDCTFQEWGEWSGCTKCGGGFNRRIRDIANKPCKFPGGDDNKLIEAVACEAEECEQTPCKDCAWGPWGEWSACSVTGSQKTRKRFVAQSANHCGKPCSETAAVQVAACQYEPPETYACIFSEWSSTAGCSKSCGKAVKREERHLSLIPVAELQAGDVVLFKGTHDADAKCAGTESRLVNCSGNQACPPKCTPINCELGEWSDWAVFGAGCTGLKQRSRQIETQKNECGKPCSGVLTETMETPDPCNQTAEASFCDWSEWTSCLNDFGQRTRYRFVEGCQGVHDCSGLLDFTKLSGALKETSPCGGRHMDMDCQFSEWHEWSCCSATCGGGRKQRHRAIVTPAQGNGAPCEGALTEGEECGLDPCGTDLDCKLGEWQDWQEDHCTSLKGFGQRSKHRDILQASNGTGKPCEGALVELAACPPYVQDCEMTDWTDWSECTRSCGGGQQKKERVPKELPFGQGAETCPTVTQVTQGCNTQSCSADEDCVLTDWSTWSDCTRSCGGGQANRTRSILKAASGIGGLGCAGALTQVEACNDDPCEEDVDCVWGDWHDWSGCTKTCGSGTQRRHRRILQFPLNNGKKCAVENKEMIQTCNKEECDVCVDGKWGEWTEWTECTVTCGSGTSWRHRKVLVMANECGAEPVGSDTEVKELDTGVDCPSKDVDCKLQPWGDWHGCSAVCDGYKRRVRDIAVHGQANGDFCQAEEGCKPIGGTESCTPAILEEFVHCGDKPELCEKKPEENIDCVMGEWSEWACPVTCGRGQALQTRKVITMAKGTGTPCATDLNRTAACQGLEKCGDPPQDCEYGPWSEWGACTKCSGQRYRQREVATQASNGGVACVANSTRETKGCPRKCGEPLFCTWEDWQDWSACDKNCGSGKRERKRVLALTSEDTYENRMEMVNADLQQQLDAQKDANVRQVVMAFSAGAVALLLAVGGFRAWKATSTRQRRPSFQREAAYE